MIFPVPLTPSYQTQIYTQSGHNVNTTERKKEEQKQHTQLHLQHDSLGQSLSCLLD